MNHTDKMTSVTTVNDGNCKWWQYAPLSLMVTSNDSKSFKPHRQHSFTDSCQSCNVYNLERQVFPWCYAVIWSLSLCVLNNDVAPCSWPCLWYNKHICVCRIRQSKSYKFFKETFKTITLASQRRLCKHYSPQENLRQKEVCISCDKALWIASVWPLNDFCKWEPVETIKCLSLSYLIQATYPHVCATSWLVIS